MIREKGAIPLRLLLFGKQAGYVQLQQHYVKSKELLKDSSSKALLKTTIEMSLLGASDEIDSKNGC
jgi:hypothetical protein